MVIHPTYEQLEIDDCYNHVMMSHLFLYLVLLIRYQMEIEELFSNHPLMSHTMRHTQ